MKTLALKQIQNIAYTHGGRFVLKGLRPYILFNGGEYGFVGTDVIYNDSLEFLVDCNGFEYFGPSSKKTLPYIRDCWHSLTGNRLLVIHKLKQVLMFDDESDYLAMCGRRTKSSDIGHVMVMSGEFLDIKLREGEVFCPDCLLMAQK